MKFLLLLAVLGVAYMVWRHKRLEQGGTNRQPAPPKPPPGAIQPLEMVRCPQCGVHVPRADAVADEQGRLYCSREHREAARR
jgi:uncharacterized protein